MFVTNAISPARVQRVSILDDGDRIMEVVVEDKQLSLAIGKKGQNVRLAAKLTGWKIDIKSEEEKRKEVEEQFAQLAGDMIAEGEAEAEGAAQGEAEAEASADAAGEAQAADQGAEAPEGDAQADAEPQGDEGAPGEPTRE
jgi:N utilization substance protein A